MDLCGPRVLDSGATCGRVIGNEVTTQGKKEVSNSPGNGGSSLQSLPARPCMLCSDAVKEFSQVW